MQTSYYLSAVGNLSAAVTLGQGLPTDINGQPVKYFWADAITEGEYIHPVQKFRLSVDKRRMDGWVETFQKMKAGGVDVTVNADHSDRARDALGAVVDMKREGGTLRVLHQLIGDDAIRMAARNKVSLGISPNFIDGKGIAYGDAVIHSALTPVPVVPGQTGLIAASRGQSDEPLVFELAAPVTGDQPMVDLKVLRQALGAAADVKDEDVLQQAAAKLGTHKTENEALLSRATAAEAKVTELDGKIVTLSRTPTPPDPEALRDRMELSIGKIDLSVEKGDMPPFIAKKLKEKLGTVAAPNTFMLSRQAELGDRPVDFALSLFDGAKLCPKTGSQTTVQTLSRQTPDGDDTGDKVDPEAIKARVAAIGGTVAAK